MCRTRGPAYKGSTRAACSCTCYVASAPEVLAATAWADEQGATMREPPALAPTTQSKETHP
jgi:hypothetical protein